VDSVRLANIKPVVDAGCGASLTTVEPEEAPLATPPGQALSAGCGGGMERLVWQAARRGDMPTEKRRKREVPAMIDRDGDLNDPDQGQKIFRF
jgi:predicted Rdx family selenoprotein